MAENFQEFLEELLEPLGGTTIRSMFGGHGVFREGVMFGILDDGVLYLRVDDTTQPHYEAESSKPFTYEGMGRIMEMPYWRVPDRLFDDAEAFLEWAEASHAAALRAKALKQPKKPRRAAAGKPAKAAAKPPAGKRPAAKTKPVKMPKPARAAKAGRKKPAKKGSPGKRSGRSR